MYSDDPNMEAYFQSLPSKVRAFLTNSGAEIASPGELMLVGEHLRYSLGCTDEEK